MEQSEPTTQATDAEATAPPSPEVSASERSETTPKDAGAPGMDAFIRGVAAGPAPSTLKRAEGDDDAADADDTDGDPTSDAGAAEPAGTPGGKVGRRRAPAEIARLSEENARLTKALAELQPPPPPDPSDESRRASVEREQKFRELIVRPAAALTPEDYDFVEAEKERRAVVPELAAHYEAVLEADRAQAFKDAEQQLAGRWKAIGDDLKTTLEFPGVDDTVKTTLLASPLSEQIRIHRQLERQIVESEKDPKIAQLERELKDARHQGLGSARAPVGAGSSGGGSNGKSIDNWIRGRL